MENDQQWADYELEETGTQIDLSDMILEELVSETVNLLNGKRRYTY